MSESRNERSGDSTVATEIFTDTGAAAPPSIIYDSGSGHYVATCCCAFYNGSAYNNVLVYEDIELGMIATDNKGCVFVKEIPGGETDMLVTVEGDAMEPRTLFYDDPGGGSYDIGVDGTGDIDMSLIEVFGDGYTVLYNHSEYDWVCQKIAGPNVTPILYLPSVFTANGAGDDYGFNPAALGDAALWGGDGAGGSRSGGFQQGRVVLSHTPSEDQLITGIQCSFDAAGSDRRMRLLLKVDGAPKYAVPVYDSAQPNETAFYPVAGRIPCPAGSTATLEVASANTTGGVLQTALLIATG